MTLGGACISAVLDVVAPVALALVGECRVASEEHVFGEVDPHQRPVFGRDRRRGSTRAVTSRSHAVTGVSAGVMTSRFTAERG
jgi:hypothetical protein